MAGETRTEGRRRSRRAAGGTQRNRDSAAHRIVPGRPRRVERERVDQARFDAGQGPDRYTIDLEDMVEDVPSAREALEIEAQQAQEFAESLPPGKHQIASKLAEPGYNTKEENWNWFYAIGGYQSWGRAEVTVTQAPAGKEYAMDFEYRQWT